MRKQLHKSCILVLLCLLAGCNLPITPTTSQPTISPPIQPSPTAAASSTPALEPADIIFHNGTIITIEDDQPTAQAVAVKGNLIQAVGTEAEVMAHQGAGTIVVDLQGKTLMPGFEDGHMHYLRNKTAEGASIDSLMDDLVSFGLTSVTEMHSVNEFIEMMIAAEQEGRVDVRVNIFGEYDCGFLENGKSLYCPSWYPDQPPILDPTKMVRVPGVKIFLDGAGGNRGCPYNTFLWPDNIEEYWPGIWETCTYPYGDLYLTESELMPILQDIQDKGYRASFHIMGDAAIDVALNAIETVLDGQSNVMYRHQIQHSSTLRPDQMQRYAQLGLLAQVPGYFNTCEADILQAMFPDDTYTWNVNRFGLPALGVHTYFGSDANGRANINRVGSGLNPIWALYGLVTHRQMRDDMTVCEPPEWIARYNFPVMQALRMVTIEPAYAVSMEDYTGSIKAGKYADLIILSDDPLTMDPDELYTLEVWMTMVNGEQKYCASGREAWCPQGGATQLPATSAPSLEPPVAQVRMDCDAKPGSPVRVSAGNFIQTTVKWAAATSGQLTDYMSAVQPVIYANSEQIDTHATHGEILPLEGREMFYIQSNFDVGVLKVGQYVIRTLLTFRWAITDGMGGYGPGTENLTVEGICTVIVEAGE